MLWFCSRTPRACKRFHIGSLWITGWFHLNRHSCKWLVWLKIRISGRPQDWSYLVLESPFWVQCIYWYNSTVTQLHPKNYQLAPMKKFMLVKMIGFFLLPFPGGKLFNFSLSTLTMHLNFQHLPFSTPGCPLQQELRALDLHQPGFYVAVWDTSQVRAGFSEVNVSW